MPRGIIRNWKAVVDGDMSQNIESQITDAAFLDKGRAHVAWEGATSGTAKLYVEISNDKKIWRRLNFDGIVLSGAEGTHELIFPYIDFGYMLFYVDKNTEISGSLNISFSASTEGK